MRGVRLILIVMGLFVSSAHLLASTNAIETGRVTLSPEEREWITQHPVLRVGAVSDWAPFSFFDPNGKIVGINRDVLDIITERTGLVFEKLPQKSWEDLAENWDEMDMVCSVSYAPAREQVARFTQPYATAPLVIVEREGDAKFGTVSLLSDRKLALARRHYATQTVLKRLPSATVIFASTQEECFDFVKRKKADATVVNLFVASQYMNSHPEAKLAISGVISESNLALRMGVHRDLGELPLAVLNKGLASISEQEMDEIINKNLLFGLQSRGRVGLVEKRAKLALLAGAIAGIFLLLWNFFIRKEVRARRKAEAKLRETNESMQIFSHSLSHDLRAPLRGITGFAQALKEDHYGKLDGDGQDYLERIISSGSRMDHLITDVLTFSQTASSEWPMERVHLDLLVHQLVEGFPPEQRRCFQIVSSIPDVHGNATLLIQCLTNLLSNAAKFVPADRTPQVFIRAIQKGLQVTIFVEDNGIGVDPEDQKRIFKLFERAAPADYKGTGIGLAVVAKTVERMGGTVGVESEVGKGSRFWIRLPAASAQKPSARQARRSHPFWQRFVPARGT